jgi:dCMP deaminase
MQKALDLGTVYNLRSDFIIIGITGRTGSGCSEVAGLLNKGFSVSDFPAPNNFSLEHNSFRKYRIIHKYATENFRSFHLIEYKNILSLFIIKHGFDEFVKFLRSEQLYREFQRTNIEVSDFSVEIEQLLLIKEAFNSFTSYLNGIDIDSDLPANRDKLYSMTLSLEFQEFNDALHRILCMGSKVKRNKALSIISNNLRRSGNPYNHTEVISNAIFTIAKLINRIIKAIKGRSTKTQVVIDSLRTPLEIMFFRQRFASFYLMSVNAEDEHRDRVLKERYSSDYNDAAKLFAQEYNGSKANEFYKQRVEGCIQLADIHLSFLSNEEVLEKNSTIFSTGENTSPYFSWQMQLLKYVSLIMQPGIVTPSPEERCMQIALTAKYNSGCISRQVGAAITDEFYSLKAIGWNNTPEGQVPCNLRNVEDLIANDGDLEAFTPFEKESNEFREVLVKNFVDQISCNKEKLNGRNICMCFKSLRNSITEGKNQVHTRSLHAEESAFLQITKYGGNGIKGGKLFTTASPCELCSKKAYQLGIKVIYYIDPYPGIAGKQILKAGDVKHQPTVRLFNGAIGKAYNWLYEPIMSYKDELSLLLGQETTDITSTYKKEMESQITALNLQTEIINQLEIKVKALERKLEKANTPHQL